MLEFSTKLCELLPLDLKFYEKFLRTFSQVQLSPPPPLCEKVYCVLYMYPCV
jgi:hypothetical protein